MSRFRIFSKLRTPHSARRTSPNGFTVFETITVLAIISITLVVVLGSYNSWATVHALDGAARTLEAGLLHARAMSKAKSNYVMFFYETTGYDGKSVKLTSGFQSFVCTNDTDRTIITDTLEAHSDMDCLGAGDIAPPEPSESNAFRQQFIPLTSAQRLTGHVELGYVKETEISTVKQPGFDPFPRGGLIIFCPDGSVWGWNDKSEHTMVISTRKLFARAEGESSRPLRRVLRVNLATGAITTFRPEQLPDNL